MSLNNAIAGDTDLYFDQQTGELLGYRNPLTSNPEQFVGGAGATTYAALTDKSSVDLPGINGPLSNALASKANSASPALTGTPTAPTAAPGTNTTQIATTAFVAAAVSAGGGSYPEALNFAALPVAPADGTTYVVLQTQGVIFINRKPAGLYRYTSGVWVYLGEVPDGYFTDNTLRFFDNDDATKQLAFELSGISAGTTRTLTVPNASGTIALTSTSLQTSSNLSDVANTATARTNIGAAASGAVGSSGLTMSTSRLLGRSTASTGAVEEITVGTGLSLSAGTLTATGGGGGGGTKTLGFFGPMTAQPPASGFATLDTRNSIAVLDFDDTAVESSTWVGVIPEGANLSSGISARIHWMATTATSGNVRWRVEFERAGTDMDADSFDTATEGTSAANGTSGIESVAAITCTTIDSLAAGDRFRVRISRVGNDGTNDTMSGDAELIGVELRGVA